MACKVINNKQRAVSYDIISIWRKSYIYFDIYKMAKGSDGNGIVESLLTFIILRNNICM